MYDLAAHLLVLVAARALGRPMLRRLRQSPSLRYLVVTMPDWTLLEEVHKLAADKQVSWSLHFEEGPGSWYSTVGSPAKSECFVSKSHGYEITIELLIEWLQSL